MKKILDLLPVKGGHTMTDCLKSNWFFPISAAAYFAMQLPAISKTHILTLLLSFICFAVVSTQIPPVLSIISSQKTAVKIYSALSAAGICYICRAISPVLKNKPIFGIVGAVISFAAVYVCISVFITKILYVLSSTDLFVGVKRYETVAYIILFAVFLVFVTSVFSKTDAFYGTSAEYDVIYTSDSPALVKGNVYVSLFHAENDLRQPLFAVFASPFVGTPYLISGVFSLSAPARAILLDAFQLILLFGANFIIARMLKLSPIGRILFMIFFGFTYTQLLFSLMLEQYIVSYFLLILCFYTIFSDHKEYRFTLWGAGGTLLTNMAVLPFISPSDPIKNFKSWLRDMIMYAAEFLFAVVMFCRFDIIINFARNISNLMSFTGKTVSLYDKLLQYFAFISGCFIAPDAGVSEKGTWQLYTVGTVSYLGVVIFVLCIVSFVLNRKEKLARIAGGWLAYSVIILIILGWGTAENGLILYSLYFGWSFFVLLFLFVRKIGQKLRVKYLTSAFAVAGTAVFAVLNIPAIKELIRFAVNYYPV